MEMFEYILLMLAAVSLSYLINRFVPSLSIPIIQIGLGIGLSLLPLEHQIGLDPELFLLLFIAPLLFNDGRHADKKALWELKKPVFLMALGLVFLTVGVLGYSLHGLIPAIPLAAAFALAAALAPTDAVAVGALEERVKIPSRTKHILEGESLINDASGLVSFQFAVAAMVTGSFSMKSAGLGFLVISLGGVLLGLVLTVAKSAFVQWIRRLGMEDVTLHMLLEVLTPFLIFLAAEELGVNGILAVVASGIAHSFGFRKLNPELAKLAVVSRSTWSVIIFTLNGLVFLLLGTQLPDIARRIWNSGEVSHANLILYVLLITAFLLGLRFLWVLFAVIPLDKESGTSRRNRWREGLILSFGGVRGTITLASTLSLPLALDNESPFPARDLIIFLAAGVILTTLLAANFLLPLLIGKDKSSEQNTDETKAKIEILRNVIAGLYEQASEENRLALGEVTYTYAARIQALGRHEEIERNTRKWIISCLQWERERTMLAIENREVHLLVGFRYLNRLNRRLYMYTKHERYRNDLLSGKQIRLLFRMLGRTGSTLRRKTPKLNQFQIRNWEYVVRKLNEALLEAPSELEAISSLILRYERGIARASGGGALTGREAFETAFHELARIGIQLERDYTHAAFETGRISRSSMTELRRNIALMEQDLKGDTL